MQKDHPMPNHQLDKPTKNKLTNVLLEQSLAREEFNEIVSQDILTIISSIIYTINHGNAYNYTNKVKCDNMAIPAAAAALAVPESKEERAAERDDEIASSGWYLNTRFPSWNSTRNQTQHHEYPMRLYPCMWQYSIKSNLHFNGWCLILSFTHT